ncbi:hypothetical protein GCM10010206_44170 [Streptomyces cinerochromogenes]|nr:hypothetical protein GCM10010206_44170 [Streptomyces cinerochromogenes]
MALSGPQYAAEDRAASGPATAWAAAHRHSTAAPARAAAVTLPTERIERIERIERLGLIG